MLRMGNFFTTNMTDLRSVSRIHGYDPAAVLGNVMSQPFNELSPVPAPVLHRIFNPAQVFDSNDRIIEKVR